MQLYIQACKRRPPVGAALFRHGPTFCPSKELLSWIKLPPVPHRAHDLWLGGQPHNVPLGNAPQAVVDPLKQGDILPQLTARQGLVFWRQG